MSLQDTLNRIKEERLKFGDATLTALDEARAARRQSFSDYRTVDAPSPIFLDIDGGSFGATFIESETPEIRGNAGVSLNGDSIDQVGHISEEIGVAGGYHKAKAKAKLYGMEETKRYTLIAQGDSWFDYLPHPMPSTDIISHLCNHYGHTIENIAVAGSTLNDIVYGNVPKNLFGIPQSNDVSRIRELTHKIETLAVDAKYKGYKLNGVLLSGGGNDIAGEEFFSFLNNKNATNLPHINSEVLDGVVNATFKEAYKHLIDVVFESAKNVNIHNDFHIFVHGYDYPWPDGRGVIAFNLVGPWFHEPFNKKNFPFENDADLIERKLIVGEFIDKFNKMLSDVASEYEFVHYVDLRNTLPSGNVDDKDTWWANELHPLPEGFEILADKFNLILQEKIG